MNGGVTTCASSISYQVVRIAFLAQQGIGAGGAAIHVVVGVAGGVTESVGEAQRITIRVISIVRDISCWIRHLGDLIQSVALHGDGLTERVSGRDGPADGIVVGAAGIACRIDHAYQVTREVPPLGNVVPPTSFPSGRDLSPQRIQLRHQAPLQLPVAVDPQRSQDMN